MDRTPGPVRDFFIENAEYWIEEFHLDGLRLDAVHAIKDDARPHFLDELATRLRSRPSRPIHLLLENESNDPRRLTRHGGKPDLYDAQWNDDIHHVLHVAATHETAATTPPMAGRSFWEEPSPRASPIRAR